MGDLALASTWYGSFLWEDDEVLEHQLFPEEPEAIAQRLAAVRDGEVLDEERTLVAGRPAVSVGTRRLLSLSNTTIGPVPATTPESTGQQPDPGLLKQATLHLARATIRDGLAQRPRHLMQAVSYLDESHEVENLLGERLVAWLTLHAPEVVGDTDDHAALARKLLAHDDLASLLASQGVKDSLGAPLAPREREAVCGLAQVLVDHVETRKPLEGYIGEVTEAMAPNLTTLLGPTLAARLIHHAGGLLNLAKLPASTVQTLGAEKALFRHFTEGAPPPKHGVLFQHPLVHRAHPNDRGSIARALSAKASIAARVDAFGDKRIGAELKAEVEDRAEEVSRIGRRRAMAKRGGRSQGGGGGGG